MLRYRDLIRSLTADAHEVVFYVKRTDLAHRVYGGHAVRIESIPALDLPRIEGPATIDSFSDILLRTAFHDIEAARRRVREWQRILRDERPDVLVFDYSPCAMLANRACRIPSIACGNSFYNPPRTRPLPPYRYWQASDVEGMRTREADLLERLNQARPMTSGVLDNVAALFETNRTLLHTFPELDFFPHGEGREYVGAFPPEDFGVEPPWPEVPGPRVFAYLQPSPGSRRVLAALQARRLSAVIYCPGVGTKGSPLPQAPHLHYATEPISIASASRQCDLAINNGNLTTTAGFLLAGKPQLLLPYTLEKYLVARCVERLDAGLAATDRDPLLETKLDAVLERRDYARGAERVDARYARQSLRQQTGSLHQAILTLV